jgi:[ribosomal protein S5]-alanine N-acetyltransferase
LSIVLETERLIVRRWREVDAEGFFSLVSDAEVMRYIGDGRPWLEMKATHEWLAQTIAGYREQAYGRWAVVERATGRVVGSCGYGAPEIPAEIELGYLFARDVWGRGYATEAARACLAYGFDRLGFKEVGAGVAFGHAASCRVLEKIGFVYVGPHCFGEGPDDTLFYLARRPASANNFAPPQRAD